MNTNFFSTSFKKIAIFLVATMAMSCVPLVFNNVDTDAAGKKVTVFVNKKKVKTTKKFAVKRVGKVVLVPAKQFAKALKAKYKFSSNKVNINKASKKVTLTVNSVKAKIGKKNFKLRKKVTLTNGMPMVDAVSVAKKLGYKFSKYLSGKKALYIASSKSKLPGAGSDKDGYEEEYNPATPIPTLTPTPIPTFSIDPNQGADTYRKTGLPVVFINTNDGSKPVEKIYEEGMMCIEKTGVGGVKLLEDTKIEISVRGNSTSSAVKKPYKFRFVDNEDGTNNKKEVLGMSAHHKWNLLANAYDKSLLRNAVALKFASQLSGLDFTPDFKFVDVVMNGEYIGNYMLTERVEIANERVNIQKKNEAGDKFGYIVEWDQRASQSWAKNELDWDYFNAQVPGNGTVAFSFKDPEPDDFLTDVSGAKRTYIANDVRTTWQKISAASNSNTEFLDYVDIDSFIDFYIVQELMKPIDGFNFSSIYFYKDSTEGAKMHAGPAWDYDLSLGNTDADQITSLFYFSAGYCEPFRKHAATKQKYKDRWKEVQTIAADMVDYIDATAKEIKASADLNYQRWSITNTDHYDGAKRFNSFDEAVNSLKDLYQKRYNALNGAMTSWW